MRSLIGQGTANRPDPDGDRTVFRTSFGLLMVLCIGILLFHVIESVQALLKLWSDRP